MKEDSNLLATNRKRNNPIPSTNYPLKHRWPGNCYGWGEVWACEWVQKQGDRHNG